MKIFSYFTYNSTFFLWNQGYGRLGALLCEFLLEFSSFSNSVFTFLWRIYSLNYVGFWQGGYQFFFAYEWNSKEVSKGFSVIFSSSLSDNIDKLCKKALTFQFFEKFAHTYPLFIWSGFLFVCLGHRNVLFADFRCKKSFCRSFLLFNTNLEFKLRIGNEISTRMVWREKGCPGKLIKEDFFVSSSSGKTFELIFAKELWKFLSCLFQLLRWYFFRASFSLLVALLMDREKLFFTFYAIILLPIRTRFKSHKKIQKKFP